MAISRVDANRALSKAIAYKNAGNNSAANTWAEELIRILECADILSSEKISKALNDIEPNPWETPTHFGEEDWTIGIL